LMTLLQTAIHTADEAIWASARAQRELRGMGTTVVLAVCQAEQVYIAHVGDSRAYLFHHDVLRQVTQDHSVVARLLEAGEITPQEARAHPLRHQITRCLGERDAVADLHCIPWQSGDVLLLCSDGLTTMMEDDQIAALLRQAGADVQTVCEALVAQA